MESNNWIWKSLHGPFPMLGKGGGKFHPLLTPINFTIWMGNIHYQRSIMLDPARMEQYATETWSETKLRRELNEQAYLNSQTLMGNGYGLLL